MYAYVGSRTTRERNARGEGISVYRVDEANGQLSLIQKVSNLTNPSFIAINRSNTFLYTVHGDRSEVSAFSIDQYTGKITFINQQSCQGNNPVHLAFDSSEQFLVVSNHLSGELVVMEIHRDGSLGGVVQQVKLQGTPGPHRVEQSFSKPHFNLFSLDGRLVVVPDKGLDRIFSFEFSNGRLIPTLHQSIITREGSGPRHAIFHPLENYLYVINELDSTVGVYCFIPESSTFTPIQVITTLPTDFTGNNRAAEIAIDKKGRFLYASNRGANNLAIYKISPLSAKLSLVGFCSTGGNTPRFFTLSPDGSFLFVLNEDSDNIITFKVNGKTGIPDGSVFECRVGSPVCMVFSKK